ncbi:MAG: cell division protein ZipA [Oceanospirillales bacterium]|nr:cell division protein ZipA [Oceanospirillales bacterium]
MEISLREWLIIGGILVIALILFDGWRRIRGNRNRIRLDIDRSAIGEAQAEESPLSNPELPNGGARRRNHQGVEVERHEPTFAADASPVDEESDRLPEFDVQPERANSDERIREEEEQPQFEVNRSGATKSPDDALQHMDPLFDDVPVEPRPKRAKREPVPTMDTAYKQAVAEEASPPLRAQREEDDGDAEPLEMSFDFDPEQPIPVLMDRVRASSSAVERDDSRVVDAASPKRTAANKRRHPQAHPELPFDDADTETEDVVETHYESQTDVTEPAPLKADRNVDTGRANTAASVSSERDKKGQRPAPEITPNPEDMLVIFVVAHRGETLSGAVIHRIVDACGMDFGEMGIFHRYEQPDAKGSLQFSMANALQPGTFDYATLDTIEVPAVTFFMSMHDPADALEAYECMLATAETLARHLDAELLDGDRSVMRPQTKEHYRERIRDFEIHRRVKRAH